MGLYFDTPTPPAVPDPAKTASAQTGSNISTAIANSFLGNANQYGPTGSTVFNPNGNTYRVTGSDGTTYDVPQFDQHTTLSPEQQKLYDQQTALGSSMNGLAQGQVNRLNGVLNQPLSFNGMPSAVNSINPGELKTSFNPGGGIQGNVNLNSNLALNTNAPTAFGQTAGKIQYGYGPDDYSKDRTRVEDALYSRLQPQMDRDRAALESRLANQGVTQGSEAYNRAMDSLNRSNTDARMQAILAGGQEQSRLAGLDYNRANFNNAAQGQDYGQQQGRGIFAQQGISQNNDALLGQETFNNSARLAQGQFANQAQQQQFGQNESLANFYNLGTQQNFQNSATAAGFANDARSRAIQEELTLRNQPINEISALMSGGQVSMPQYASYNAGNIAGTDTMGAVYNSAALRNQQYQQQVSQQNAALGGLFGLGSSAILGASGLGGISGIKKLFGGASGS